VEVAQRIVQRRSRTRSRGCNTLGVYVCPRGSVGAGLRVGAAVPLGELEDPPRASAIVMLTTTNSTLTTLTTRHHSRGAVGVLRCGGPALAPLEERGRTSGDASATRGPLSG